MSTQAATLRSRIDAGILNALFWGIPTAANAAMLLFLFDGWFATGPGAKPWLLFLALVFGSAIGQMALGTRLPKFQPLKHSVLFGDPTLSLSEKLKRLRQDDSIVMKLIVQGIVLSLLAVTVMTFAR